MDLNHDPNDDLRQECIELLKNYVPDQKVRKKPIDSPDSSCRNFVQDRANFREKNEIYVQAVRNVVRMNREAARQRNIQAFKGFFQNLINEPVKEEIPVTLTKSPKRKKSPNTQVPKRRKISQECPSPPQDVFYLQQPEYSYQEFNNFQQIDLSFHQTYFYQMPSQPNFYYQKQFNQDYYQQCPNNFYAYQN